MNPYIEAMRFAGTWTIIILGIIMGIVILHNFIKSIKVAFREIKEPEKEAKK